MKTPAATIARGTVRRGLTISSPIVDPLSMPPKAKAIVDQKITSLRLMLGTSAAAVIGVADPNRPAATTPNTMRNRSGTHAAAAPTLFSHLPTFSPTRFRSTAIERPTIDTAMKYGPLVESDCHDGPPMNTTLPAAKYKSPGK